MTFRLVGLIVLFALSAPAPVHADLSEPRLVAATFRSAWCGPCRVLEPRFEAVAADYADAQVEFVTFDFTLGRRARLAERAAQEGVAEPFRAHGGGTGFVLLVDRNTGDVLGRITMHYSDADMRGALDHALSVIEDRDDFGL